MTHGLVERQQELAEIAALLDGARRGDGGVLLLRGPAGIGKTALLDAGAELADGLRVLRGLGGELERELSFGLVRELLEPTLRTADAAHRRRWLSGAAAAAAAVLGDAGEGPTDAASAAYGLYWLLATIADEQAVLLIADDLHWSDRASLRWLGYLARRIDGLPVALLAASRPEDADLPGDVERLAAIEGVRVRRPAALSLAATGELIARRSSAAPDGAFTQACHVATGGNPLLLRELLQAARDAGLGADAHSAAAIGALSGEPLRRAVLGRLARLPARAARLARAVAVLGDGCELRIAGRLAGIDGEQAVAAATSLVAAGVLADRRPLAFEHPLLRTAVHLDIPASARAAEHARAAALLANSGIGAEAVAGHLLAAEPVGEAWAASALRDAARSALDCGAPDSAAAYLRRALAERPAPPARGELLLALGNALSRLGDPEAPAVLAQALEHAATDAARVQIVGASFDALGALGRYAEARALLLDRLDAADPDDRETLTRLAAQLAVVAALGGGADASEPIAALRARVGDIDPATATGRYAAGALALLGAVSDGTAAEVRELALSAVGDDARHAADARAGQPLHIALVALAIAGDPEAAVRASTRGIEASRARGSLMGQGLGLAWRALIDVIDGRVEAAENDGREALAVLSDAGLAGPAGGATAAIAWALAERGDARQAQELLDGVPEQAGWLGAGLRCIRAQVMMALHRHAEACALLTALEQDAERAGWRSGDGLPWRSLAATAQLAAGDLPAAQRLAAAELAEAQRFGSAREIGRALRVRGVVEGDDATLCEAIARLREAGPALELARALVDHGAAQRRAGERARSRTSLAEGMELAHHAGATALAARARTELRAAGARPRSVVRSGVAALTPSEHRVAGLAAEGLSNAEVAQALFVTVRTIEMHLSAAYRKLEIASRAELAGALAAGAHHG